MTLDMIHRLLSQKDREEFDVLLAEAKQKYTPGDGIENNLIENLVYSQFKLDRIEPMVQRALADPTIKPETARNIAKYARSLRLSCQRAVREFQRIRASHRKLVKLRQTATRKQLIDTPPATDYIQ